MTYNEMLIKSFTEAIERKRIAYKEMLKKNIGK